MYFWRETLRAEDATPGPPMSIQLTPDGSQLVAASLHGVLSFLERDGDEGGLSHRESSVIHRIPGDRELPERTRAERRLAIHPNGRFFYGLIQREVGSSGGGRNRIALAVRSDDGAALTVTASYMLDSPLFLNTLHNLDSMEISPDGQHLYLFSRNHQDYRGDAPTSEVWRADVDQVNGQLSSPQRVLSMEGPETFEFRLSEDGRFALITSVEEVLIVDRNLETGALDSRPALPLGGGGGKVAGTDGLSSFLVQADLKLWRLEIEEAFHAVHLLAEPGECCGLAIFPLTGRLFASQDVIYKVAPNPSFQGEAMPGGVMIFDRQGPNQATYRGLFRFPDALPSDCAIDQPSGRTFLYCTMRGNVGTISLSEVAADGDVSLLQESLTSDRLPNGPSRAVATAFSPDGRHLYAASRRLGSGETPARIIPDSSVPALGLPEVEPRPITASGHESVAAVVHPNGKTLYTVGELGVEVFARDVETGELAARQRFGRGVVATGPLDELLPAGHALLNTPGGRQLIVATNDRPISTNSPCNEGTIVTANLDTEGRIVDAEAVVHEEGEPRLVALAPDGRSLYASSWTSSCLGSPPEASLSVYERDPTTGALALVEVIRDTERFFASSSLFVSPDGQFVYTWNDLLSIYRRDQATGRLALEAELGSEVLPSPERIVQSVDGRWVFGDVALETSPAGHAIYGNAVYQRDFESGLLTLASLDERSLPQSTALALAPNGESLFRFDAAGVTWLQRNCVSSDDTLCLRAEDRFKIEVDWQDFDGDRGRGRLVADGQSSQSGLVYFFRPDNWEMLVKIIDGCTNNGHFWVFGAATTNVAYSLRVTDTWTGTTATYENTLGTASPAITDTGALATCDAPAPVASGSVVAGTVPSHSSSHPETFVSGPALAVDAHARFIDARITTRTGEPGSCDDTGDAVCLLDGRFRATVQWRAFDGREGAGERVPIPSDDSGLFSFFSPNNWEMLVKVIDGCAANGRLWVFGAATTNVAYDLTVTDTLTGEAKVYENALGTAAPAIVDTQAFASCP